MHLSRSRTKKQVHICSLVFYKVLKKSSNKHLACYHESAWILLDMLPSSGSVCCLPMDGTTTQGISTFPFLNSYQTPRSGQAELSSETWQHTCHYVYQQTSVVAFLFRMLFCNVVVDFLPIPLLRPIVSTLKLEEDLPHWITVPSTRVIRTIEDCTAYKVFSALGC